MNIRWKSVIFYRTEKGLVDVPYDLEELLELQDRVEAGPHWDTIDHIEISRVNHCEDPGLTVERARDL